MSNIHLQLPSTFTCQCWRLMTLWHGDFVSCRTKAVCSMAHIHSIIFCIMRSKNNDVVHDFDVVTNWDLTTLCPGVIKRAVAGCMARESTGGLHFTFYWRWEIFFSYSGWTCASKKKTKIETTKQRDTRIKPKTTHLSWYVFSYVSLNFYQKNRPASKRVISIFFHSVSFRKVLELIYETRVTVLHKDIQTPRRELKIRRAAEYSWRNSRCSDSWRNTVSNIFSI